jgi:hypothetical protein
VFGLSIESQLIGRRGWRGAASMLKERRPSRLGDGAELIQENLMRSMSIIAAALAAQTLVAGVAEAQTKPHAAKAPSTAECVMLLGPFRGKANAAVKDQDVQDYGPLVKSYWKKHCPADLYQQEIADADLRKRIEAVAPAPRSKRAPHAAAHKE